MFITLSMSPNAYLFQYVVKGEIGCSAGEVDESVRGLDPSLKLGVVLPIVWMRIFQDVVRVLCLQPDPTLSSKCTFNRETRNTHGTTVLGSRLHQDLMITEDRSGTSSFTTVLSVLSSDSESSSDLILANPKT
jgi:hypothetical protein